MIQKTLKCTSKLLIQEKTVSRERRENAEGEKDGKNLAFKHIKVETNESKFTKAEQSKIDLKNSSQLMLINGEME